MEQCHVSVRAVNAVVDLFVQSIFAKRHLVSMNFHLKDLPIDISLLLSPRTLTGRSLPFWLGYFYGSEATIRRCESRQMILDLRLVCDYAGKRRAI